MWRLGHYQFFPLLAIVAGWLIYDRVGKLPKRNGATTVSMVGLGLNTILLFTSVVFYSSTLWIISFLFLLGLFIYQRWDQYGFWKAASALSLFLFIVPLPMRLDIELITRMQFVASQLASWILDSVGQIHFRDGVVLVTEKKQFFTEEACSGVRSLFSSLAAISIFGVSSRYPWWRHLINLSQTIIWVIVGNAIRVAIVVYVADNWTDSIATGTTHEMLGLVMFLFIFGLSLSTDRAIDTWNSSRESLDRNSTTVAEHQITTANTSQEPHSFIRWAIILSFVLIFVFSARMTYVKHSKVVLDYYYFSRQTLPSAEQSDLPSEINGWKLTEYDHKLREGVRLLAPESFLWTYVKDGKKILISLDSPYPEFHHLYGCYSGLGWKVSFDHRYQEPGSGNNSDNLTFLDMQRRDEHGVVFFTAYDRLGELVLPNSTVPRSRDAIRNIRLAFGMLNAESDPMISSQALPISQIQLLHTSPSIVGETEELRNLFLVARTAIKKSRRFSGKQIPEN